MPNIYLSPSLQSFNNTILGVSEQYLMGLIADAVEPLLPINGIEYKRNRVGMTLNEVIAESNAGNYDLHIAIHSNAAPIAGTATGSRIYYFPNSVRGRNMASFLALNFKTIYYDPAKVGIYTSGELAELSRVRAPAVIIETAFHDNLRDAQWIQNNIQNIAEAIVVSICEYFQKPFIQPCMVGNVRGSSFSFSKLAYGFICTEESPLNIRSSPGGSVLFSLPKGTQVVVLSGRSAGYIKIRYNFWEGYASENYLCVCNGPALPFSAVPGVVATTGGNLNLRQSPSTSGAILTVMPNNSQLVVLGTVGSFYQVNYNGTTGFASTSYIRRTNL